MIITKTKKLFHTGKVKQEHLPAMIMIIKDIFEEEELNTHKKLSEKISGYFKCTCTKEDIDIYYSPTPEEEELDKRMIYEHCL